MAIKLTITSSYTWTDGTDTLAAKGSQVVTPTGVLAAESIQTMATTWTSIQMNGIAPGYMFLENKDATNTISVASDSTGAHIVCVLKPKEAYPLATTVTQFWGQASGAASNLLVQVCQS